VNPSLAKENPHEEHEENEEHEEHKRLLVSTTFHKRSIACGREIFGLARWPAEVHKDPAPVLANSRLTLVLTGLATSGGASEDRKSARGSIDQTGRKAFVMVISARFLKRRLSAQELLDDEPGHALGNKLWLITLNKMAALSPLARDLPRVSVALPQPGDSGRRLGAGHGGCCAPENSGARKSDFREP